MKPLIIILAAIILLGAGCSDSKLISEQATQACIDKGGIPKVFYDAWVSKYDGCEFPPTNTLK